eukprot:281571_1
MSATQALLKTKIVEMKKIIVGETDNTLLKMLQMYDGSVTRAIRYYFNNPQNNKTNNITNTSNPSRNKRKRRHKKVIVTTNKRRSPRIISNKLNSIRDSDEDEIQVQVNFEPENKKRKIFQYHGFNDDSFNDNDFNSHNNSQKRNGKDMHLSDTTNQNFNKPKVAKPMKSNRIQAKPQTFDELSSDDDDNTPSAIKISHRKCCMIKNSKLENDDDDDDEYLKNIDKYNNGFNDMGP